MNEEDAQVLQDLLAYFELSSQKEKKDTQEQELDLSQAGEDKGRGGG